MSCSSCFNILLPACPPQLIINGGLDASTTYRWEITDKFQRVYNGIAETDDAGLLAIDIQDNTDIPKGLFMSFSGSFYLKVLKNVGENEFESTQFTIDEIDYDCIELLFKDYIPASNYFNNSAPVYVSEL